MQRFRSVVVAVIFSLCFVTVAVGQPASPSGIRIIKTVRGSVTGVPLPQATILALDFVDPSHGYLSVAASPDGGSGIDVGRLLATDNGGETWRTATQARFQALAFVSGRSGYGLTADGRLLATANGGRRWRQVHAFSGVRYASNDALSFPDVAHGWINTGRGLFRTVNGGKTWGYLPFHCPGSALPGGITGISFVNDHLGFLLCNSGNGPSRISLFRTENGARHWTPVSTVDALSHVGGTLDFRSPSLGFVTRGFGCLARTVDGGRIFQPVLGTPFENVQGMSWVSGHTGYAFLLNVVETTADAGRHWRQVYPVAQPLGAISFSSARDGIGAATPWDPSAILGTADGGANWHQLTSLPNTTIDRFVRQPGGTLWAVATVNDPRGGAMHVSVLRASSEEAHWQTIKTLPGGSAALSFVTPQLGYLVDSFPTPTGFRSVLYRSTNGGRTWGSALAEQQVGNVQFTSPTVAWGFGQGKTYLPRLSKSGFKSVPHRHVTVLYKTTDAGRSWREIPIGLAGFIPTGLVFLGPNHGWLTGSQCQVPGRCSSVLLRTTDGGSAWEMIRLGSFFLDATPLSGLDAVSPFLAFINTGVAIYRTRDGGTHWSVISQPEIP